MFGLIMICVMIDGVEKARCKKCSKFYNPTSNTTLRTHKSGCSAVSQNDTSQGTIGADGQVFIFDNDAVRLDFTKFVIQQALHSTLDNVKLSVIIQKEATTTVSHEVLVIRDCGRTFVMFELSSVLLFVDWSMRFEFLDSSWTRSCYRQEITAKYRIQKNLLDRFRSCTSRSVIGGLKAATRISIFTVELLKEYHSDVLAIITRIMRRT
ncbi:hypothetical protein Tco_1530610 [Tanacetum coccineum]